MKRFIVFFSIQILLTASFAYSQHLIAIHHNGIVSYETRLDSAVKHSQAWDTIYLPGASFNADRVTIDKPLHIVGVGYDIDSTFGNPSIISNKLKLMSGADGGSITGCYFTDVIIVGSDTLTSKLNQFRFERNYITSFSFYANPGIPWANPSRNILFIENVIYNESDLGGAHTYMVNNIIRNRIRGIGNESVFRNNSFLYYYGFWPSQVPIGGTKLIIQNNIFQTSSVPSYCTNCRIEFNINGGSAGTRIDSRGNYQSNNYSVDCDSIYMSIGPSGCSKNYDQSYDFHLVPGSPGISGGKDGTNVGIYGGTSPWKAGGVPFNPHIEYKEIAPVTTDENTLPVKIKVRAQER